MATEINSETIKEYGIELGATVVGIADAKDFNQGPSGFKPTDALKECNSVIVLGYPFPQEAITDDSVEYIDVRKEINEKMNTIAKDLEKKIKSEGYKARAINGMSGKWVNGEQFGLISLKHAAEFAGLGTITRNYLLTNQEYGNLLWFSAVLTTAELSPDEKPPAIDCEDCMKCVEMCPIDALDSIASFKKKECGKNMMKMENKKWKIDCFLCREVCPKGFGEAGN
jgi:epoxyqueuosine reductase QueG